MQHRMRPIVTIGLAALLLVSAIALGAYAGGTTGPSPNGDPVGGGFYFCALGQTLKIIGLFTANPGMVLGGAILGGVACGLGY